MVEEADRLVSEIQQIKAQYVAEVGSGRKAWPRSIKERIARLDELGIAPKMIAKRCEVPYDTIILWRYKREKQSPAQKFHEIAVKDSPISKSGTVTVPDFEMLRASSAEPGLRLITPSGFAIEGLNEISIVRFIRELSKATTNAL